MPLMRIRSVEIIFEDEMSACTDIGLLDRSMELIVSDSDDSTKCIDDMEPLQVEKEDNDDSITLNAGVDLSDDNSVSISKENEDSPVETNILVHGVNEIKAEPGVSVEVNNTSSLNLSEIGDSGRFTEEASSSHVESSYDDAMLSHSFDAVNFDEISSVTIREFADFNIDEAKNRLYEYIDSNSESSDDTAVCDDTSPETKFITSSDVVNQEQACDNNDLQYDSFIDMGKF